MLFVSIYFFCRVMFRSASLACVFLRSFSTTSGCMKPLQDVRGLCVRGHLQEALSLFYALNPSDFSLESQQIYAALFQACASQKCLQQGQALHHHMLTFNPNSPSDLYLTNHLINMYAKCGDLKTAHQLFDEMPSSNFVSWTALISGYAQHGRGDDCFNLFARMLAHCHPNEHAYASVLAACDGFRGRQVHSLALKTSFDTSVHVANALITMYSKSYHNDVSDGDDNEAWTVFKTMAFRNLISWNSMIAGPQIRRRWTEATYLFCLMHGGCIGFDRATLLSVLSSLAESNGRATVSGLKFSFQLHCLTNKTGLILDIGVATALLKAYSNLGGEITDCYNLFLETSGHRDVVLWTVIMTTFSERDPEKTLFLFRQSLREGLNPNPYAFCIVLKACAGFVTERHASVVHALLVKAGFEDDTVLANALIHVYARSGSVTFSKKVFNRMGCHDTVSWNSMLKAYAIHGQANEALQFFAQMNIQPDAATFIALLSACSHAGMVEEGTLIFDVMTSQFGIQPQLDHFACIVDILGRAGHLLEAEKVIRNMPMEPDKVVWSALLGACRKHGETQLADLASKRLMELDPENSLGYVSMSNAYSAAGSFNKACLIRKEMVGLGVRKAPGLSWTEVRNHVHEFTSGGQYHPQAEAIRANLEELVGQLKGLGYVPETNLALHDIEVEHKEEQLYYHSEKLALVFALMNVKNMHSNGSTIRIMKNIRICVDCHNFMKLASELIRREIVVRDSNRFHHFKDRACSCNDYW